MIEVMIEMVLEIEVEEEITSEEIEKEVIETNLVALLDLDKEVRVHLLNQVGINLQKLKEVEEEINLFFYNLQISPFKL